MATTSTRDAAEARERGNDLYREGRFSEASKEYQNAATLDPSNPSPLSNLSAVSFETGRYAECVDFAAKALGLLKAGPANDTLEQKLLVRQAKAYLHLSSPNNAEDISNRLEPGKEANDLRNLIKGSGGFGKLSSQRRLLREMVLQLPRLKPCIQDEPEYFGSGDDAAESVYTAELEKTAGKDPVLSMMFCGVSDARHVFCTLLQYSSENKGPQKLHITMLDHKPIVIARDLVFFSMLQEVATNQDSKESKEVTLLSLSYVYCAQIIPQFAWGELQGTIKRLLDRLEKKQQPTDMVYLPVQQMDKVMNVLKSWQNELATLYKPSQIRRSVAENTAMLPEMEIFFKFKIDRRTFNDFSVLFPPEDMLPILQPGLSTLFADYQAGKHGARKHVSSYLNQQWKVNVTLLDAKLQARYMGSDALGVMGKHPFRIIFATARQLFELYPPTGSMSCLKYMMNFFEEVSLSLLQLQDRLTIEMIVGDMAEVLERIRYDVLDLDRPKQGGDVGDSDSSTTVDWPARYHSIHMNNVPDYVGGSLTSFLYGTPILNKGAGTGLTMCILRNPNLWSGLDHFNSEHLLMHDRKLVEQHFQVKLAKGPPEIVMPFDLCSYHRWERCESIRPYPLEQLISRPSFSKWLYAHFLKICIPFPRPQATCPAYAPLNMTVIPRLLARMSELGYPGHWLSSIITSLGCGSITTTARAPWSIVLSPAADRKKHPSRTICVKPWSAEFTTLVAQWRGLLPFTVVVPSGILPPPEAIAEYSIRIPHAVGSYLDTPHFTLVFWNSQKYGTPPQDLYKILLDDERGDMTTSAQKIRADGINILSTFKYVSDHCTATFWLRSDTMDLMLREDWRVFIWRTDSWSRHTPGLPLKNAVVKKRNWEECVAA
ncbi:hypothetical protein F5Y00DRAFT_233431 [Daldinia vernicosa]|uniref:uncharacterized protein n=1 Tax=Daldinia vernicosa TaxID=114800 RepID=UPI0020072239|nr:uncharacterized protein F5Y00DRAFT_233431 [Daldinia vernicosa]KAI0850039.1 hypothetical protein F5Y00DRAFT_233431 [Daldinia vernicosa]